MPDFKITAIKVDPATSDNKSKEESNLITIQTDFFGSKHQMLENRKYFRENYEIGPPIKIQIFEAIRGVKLHNGVPIPFSIIFYEMAADSKSNVMFIDLIYDYEGRKLKTYKVLSIDNENDWKIKDINEPNVKIEFKEH